MKKKYIIWIPSFGSYRFEGTEAEVIAEVEVIKAKGTPEIAAAITWREKPVSRPFSDTELKAMEEE